MSLWYLTTSLLCLSLAAGYAAGADATQAPPPADEAASAARTQPASQPATRPAFSVVVTNEEEDVRNTLFVRHKKDKDGRLPQDVVVAFLKDLAVGDVTSARQWWADINDDNPWNDSTFEDYFWQLRKQLQDADRVAIIMTGRGKGNFQPFWRAYRGEERILQEFHFVKLIDDQWRILRWHHW